MTWNFLCESGTQESKKLKSSQVQQLLGAFQDNIINPAGKNKGEGRSGSANGELLVDRGGVSVGRCT